MALSLDRAAETLLRHVVARSRGRHVLFPDAAARAASEPAPGRTSAQRHGLQCLVWCVTDRCLHVVMRGRAGCERARERRARRHAAALRSLPVDGRQCRSLPARSRAPRAARAGACGPRAARDRLAAFERARVLRTLPRSRLARPDAALRTARPARRTAASDPLSPLHRELASRPQRLLDQRRRASRRGSRPRTAHAARRARRPAR